MTISLYTGTVPALTQTQPEFDANTQDFIDYIAALAPELNDYASTINNESTNATSTSSVAIGTGSKSFTTQTNKGYFVGMALKIVVTADVTKYMIGAVTAYNSSTGALTVNVTSTNGSGTFSAWSISFTVEIPSNITVSSITSTTSVLGNATITGGSITGITDLAVADGGTGRSTLAANAVLIGNGTSGINSVAPGTSGNVLTSNGTAWTSAALNFAKSLTTDGYQELPSGLILQWGTTNTLSNGASQTITFPKAFTTGVFQIQRSENRTSFYSGGSESYISTISTTSFTIFHKGFDTYTGSMSYYWFAIGY